MSPFNTYWFYKSAISIENCNKILSLGKSKLNDLKDQGINTDAGTKGDNDKISFSLDNKKLVPKNDKTMEEIKQTGLSSEDIENKTYIRDSEVCWLNDRWIYDLIMPFVDEANFLAGWKYSTSYTESFQFTKYATNQFYGWHQDGNADHNDTYRRYIPGISPVNKKGDPKMPYTKNKNLIGLARKLSVTINLSNENDYKGGNLKFDYGPHSINERYHTCTEIRPKGSIIVFPSYIYHQVTPITEGIRYSLVLWVNGKPFK